MILDVFNFVTLDLFGSSLKPSVDYRRKLAWYPKKVIFRGVVLDITCVVDRNRRRGIEKIYYPTLKSRQTNRHI